jgi:protein-disulfide isomerase
VFRSIQKEFLSMSHTIPKRQLREQRRAERQAKEAAERARARRNRRLLQLGGAIGLAAVVLVAAIAISSSGGTKPAAPSPGLLAGIPEHNGVLGDPKAPITVTEFVDLQCPVCAEASQTVVPPVIRNYVRPGKVKLQARTLSFLGPDSVRAARVAAGAEQQGRLWPFLETFYAKQGPENSGYVTDDFIRSVASASGVDASKALAYAGGAKSQTPLTRANAEAQKLGVTGTPTFVVQHGNGKPQVVNADGLAAALAQ